MTQSGIKEIQVLGSAGKRRSLAILGVLGFVIVWTMLSILNVVPRLLLPSPWRVILAIGDIGFALLVHVGATVVRVFVGFLLGSALGVGVGVWMQYDRRVFALLDGVVDTWRPVPPVALVPFFILWFGFAEVGKILLVTLGTGLVVTVAVVEAMERIPAGVVRWGLVTGVRRRHLFRLVLLPAAMPELRSGFRIALAIAVTLVVVSEFMGATYGLGYLINVSKVTLSTATILLGIIIIGLVSWTLDRVLRYGFDRACAWDIRAKGAIR